MAAPTKRQPHLKVFAAGRELAAYAEVTPERARQLTLRDWWTVSPVDFIGGRFVYSYPECVRLLDAHGYPKSAHPSPPRPPRQRRGEPRRAQPERAHRGVLAGVGEIARAARVPTSRAAQMTLESWWDVPALDHLAGGSVYLYEDVVRCLRGRGYPRTYRTIGERLEAMSVATGKG